MRIDTTSICAVYGSDPSGNYGGWKAMAIGANSQNATSILKTDWSDSLDLYARHCRCFCFLSVCLWCCVEMARCNWRWKCLRKQPTAPHWPPINVSYPLLPSLASPPRFNINLTCVFICFYCSWFRHCNGRWKDWSCDIYSIERAEIRRDFESLQCQQTRDWWIK